jgi:hypothetical protein
MRKVDTFAPHNDGHQWRKYGEKKINNTNFPRSGRILHVLFVLLYRGVTNLSSPAKNPAFISQPPLT